MRRDRRESLKRETLLAQREARLRSIFRAAPVGIGMVTHRVINEVNERLCRMIGYSSEELVGQSSRILYPSEEVYQQVGKDKYEQIHRKGSGTVETTLRCKDDTLIDVLLSSTPLDRQDLSAGVTFTILDITERKRTENENKRLRSLLSNITDSMPSMLVAVDTTGHVTHWNREAVEITGISQELACKNSLHELGPALNVNMGTVREAILSGEVRREEGIRHCCENKAGFVDITVYPLVLKDIIEGAVIRIDDVTQRERIREMMIHSEKMMSVGGLAAGMAHEINNPLAGILQNIQVVRNRLKNELPKNKKIAEKCGISMEHIHAYMEQRDIFSLIEAVLESGRRAREIVDKLVSFSRKSESKFASHKLNELLDKTLELAHSDYDLKKRYDFRSMNIEKHYAVDLRNVRCEGTRIQLVILNLLKNGARAMAENPDKDRAPTFILRTVEDTEEMVRIEVEDNGPGMDETVSNRIFDPFYSTRSGDMASGLGLSIAYFIVTRNHGGSITVNSTPGKGTVFSILLPFEGRETPAEEKKQDLKTK
ncbi:MAG: PAS domain S-box protein [bacterium]|nr:PAS domain S-box protein [bacterium]